jgi:hypothetical protein
MLYLAEIVYVLEKVLKPCTPIHLNKDKHYKVHIEVEDKTTPGNAWDILGE